MFIELTECYINILQCLCYGFLCQSFPEGSRKAGFMIWCKIGLNIMAVKPQIFPSGPGYVGALSILISVSICSDLRSSSTLLENTNSTSSSCGSKMCDKSSISSVNAAMTGVTLVPVRAGTVCAWPRISIAEP
mmetsp:Transcript_23993/g.36017  ORF Transcript_23993/g.36017 Transcript_23993/m.36017 type:complete len:133 (+) Transcript_23993:887-1285(+)